MADDEVAVLLQDAIAELKASRVQTASLVQQNKQLMNQNSDLTEKVRFWSPIRGRLVVSSLIPKLRFLFKLRYVVLVWNVVLARSATQAPS